MDFGSLCYQSWLREAQIDLNCNCWKSAFLQIILSLYPMISQYYIYIYNTLLDVHYWTTPYFCQPLTNKTLDWSSFCAGAKCGCATWNHGCSHGTSWADFTVGIILGNEWSSFRIGMEEIIPNRNGRDWHVKNYQPHRCIWSGNCSTPCSRPAAERGTTKN